jgi:hypothetical protein
MCELKGYRFGEVDMGLNGVARTNDYFSRKLRSDFLANFKTLRTNARTHRRNHPMRSSTELGHHLNSIQGNTGNCSAPPAVDCANNSGIDISKKERKAIGGIYGN